MKLLSVLPTARHSYCNRMLALTPGVRWAHMDSTATHHRPHPNCRFRRNDCLVDSEKIVVILGPTGSGKSRLSIDLATRFFPAEIINSDKIQVYRGLDVTTNKLPPCDRRGVRHHLLGEFDPAASELTASDFRLLGTHVVSDIASRGNLPLVVGGSNSFIYALVSSRFDPRADVFDDSRPDSVSAALRYRCCFLWVDMSLPVLNQYLRKRVDEMFESGMLEELSEYFGSEEGRKHWGSESRTGLRKAIGVPEFERYFKTFSPGAKDASPDDDAMARTRKKREVMYEEAVKAIKDNTCDLAKRQMGKILRLKEAGWDLKRLDATEAFRAAMGVAGSDSGGWSDIWERQVVEPSVKIVSRFLNDTWVVEPLEARGGGMARKKGRPVLMVD